MSPATNRREFTRAPVAAPATILFAEDFAVTATVHDVSTTGMFLTCDAVVEEGVTCLVTVQLPDGVFSATCWVMRVSEQGIGVRVARADSMSAKRLLVLVRDHLANPDAAYSDLRRWGRKLCAVREG